MTTPNILPNTIGVLNHLGQPLPLETIHYGAEEWDGKTPFLKHSPSKDSALPFVVTVPHAGLLVPDNLNEVLNSDITIGEVLARGDIFTDYISAHATEFGATHIIALASPSGFINVGRKDDSLHPDHIPGGLRGLEWNPDDPYIGGRQGLIATRTLYGNLPIYTEGQEPKALEIAKRLENAYFPFHSAIEQAHESNIETHGYSLNFDIHSMPSTGAPKDTDHGQERPDLVFSNSDGMSCSQELMDIAKQTADEYGLTIKFNDPYKGGFITQKYARKVGPQHQKYTYGQRGTESLQVEYNRHSIGLDEETLNIEDTEKFKNAQNFTSTLLARMAEYTKCQIAP